MFIQTGCDPVSQPVFFVQFHHGKSNKWNNVKNGVKIAENRENMTHFLAKKYCKIPLHMIR